MARVQTIQTNFTAGELSPRLLGRVDIARYANGAKTMENAYPLIHGGANRFPGFKFVAEVKNSAKKTRVIPFVFSTSQAYILEFGDAYMRVYKDGGQVTRTAQNISNVTNANPAVLTYVGSDTYANGDEVHISGVVGAMAPFINGRNFKVVGVNTGANTFQLDYLDGSNVDSTTWGAYGSGGTVSEVYQIATPYLEADLPQLHYTQSGDTMFQSHPGYPVKRLSRRGHTAWKHETQDFVVEPHDEIYEPNTALTLGAVTGTGISCTAAAACFINADLGRHIEDDSGGRARIVGFTSTTVVTIDIETDFASVNISAGTWQLLDSPITQITPSVATPEGAPITLTATSATWKNSAQLTDIGAYVRLNDGIVEITGFTSTTVVTGIIRRILSSTNPAYNVQIGQAAPNVWTLNYKIWTANFGYPIAALLYQQRLVLAGSTNYPNYVWGSRTALYDDFTDGESDDDGFEFQLVSDELNAIRQLGALRALVPLTYGSEFSIRGGLEKALTPTNVQAVQESAYGTEDIKPIRAGNELLYVQRGGRKARSVNYSADTEAFASSDLTVISEHITESGIVDMAYAEEPDSVVFAVRQDGVIATCTLDRAQEVVGWARRVTDGVVESCAVIPFGDIDQVWIVVKRTIDGADKRYIEYAELKREPDENAQTDSYLTAALSSFPITVLSWAAGVVSVTTSGAHGLSVGDDFRISGAMPSGYNGNWEVATTPSGTQLTFSLPTNPGASTVKGTLYQLEDVWSGFWHLEGETVDVVAEGVVYPQEVVTNGQITLPEPVFNIEAGLHYESRIELLSPEIQTQGGTAQGNQISVNEVTVRLYRSLGLKITAGGLTDAIPFRKFGDTVLDAPLEPFTGDKRVQKLGWNKTSSIILTQDQPLPFQVLAVMRKVTVND